MKIVIELTSSMSFEDAEDVLREIEDKILPDYDDCVVSMKVD